MARTTPPGPVAQPKPGYPTTTPGPIVTRAPTTTRGPRRALRGGPKLLGRRRPEERRPWLRPAIPPSNPHGIVVDPHAGGLAERRAPAWRPREDTPPRSAASRAGAKKRDERTGAKSLRRACAGGRRQAGASAPPRNDSPSMATCQRFERIALQANDSVLAGHGLAALPGAGALGAALEGPAGADPGAPAKASHWRSESPDPSDRGLRARTCRWRDRR